MNTSTTRSTERFTDASPNDTSPAAARASLARLAADPTTDQPFFAFEEEVDCLEKRYWSYFLASSLLVFFGGLIVILAGRVIQHCWRFRRPKQPPASAPPSDTDHVGYASRLKWHCEALISGQTIGGRVMVSASVFLSMGSLIIYLYDVTMNPFSNETCIPFAESPPQIVDFSFNMFFLLAFVIRFIAANDKLFFWLEIPSFVDYFTIPPSIVGIILNRQWLGMRFLRAMRIISFSDILQYLNLVRTSSSIRLAQLVCILISVWLTGAGFVQLVETSGDPFHNFENGQNLTYWESVYFCLVTMSTVGYGDIYCITTIGRAFMTIFILGALAMFASCIPEIVEILSRREKYGGFYDKPSGLRHIVLCGHITMESVQNFLQDFLHEDRENQNIKCLFLSKKSPDLELEALFKRNFTRVSFFKGTVMNTRDLERVRIQDADACLILADPRGDNPDSEDAASIMRVISIKNYFPDARVIVQLLRYTNKAFCVNLPSWTSRDQVICLAEMKLGFMAQGCLAPGASTLLANLFAMRSYKKSQSCLDWQDHYMRGAGMEVYCEFFSSAFHGKTFQQAAEIAFTKLRLLLIAVSVKRSGGESTVLLNPSQFVIDRHTEGFLICQSEDEAKRLLNFCVNCHCVTETEHIKQCQCGNKVARSNGLSSVKIEHAEDGGFLASASRGQGNNNDHGASYQAYDLVDIPRLEFKDDEPTPIKPSDGGGSAGEMLDSTGLFHWCPSRSFSDAKLGPTNRDVVEKLHDHVVLCLFYEKSSPVIGVCNFVMPLRSSSLHKNDLKSIVIVGNEDFLEREWETMACFPGVYIKVGNPLIRSDLRSIHVERCSMCVVLTTNETFTDDLTLVDKEAILCSLNIKTMVFQSPARHSSASGNKTSPGAPNLPLPMLTEFANDYNVQFLDQDDEDDPDVSLVMTQPFACGRAFAASLLDTLLSTTYFNSESLSLLRMLITGGASSELEQILAEGLGLMAGRQSPTDALAVRQRCRLALLSLNQAPLVEYIQCDTYAQLVVGALRQHGILCLGLNRLLDPRPTSVSNNRYIITNPPPEFKPLPTDKVYCLQQFRVNAEENTSSSSSSSHGVSPAHGNHRRHRPSPSQDDTQL